MSIPLTSQLVRLARKEGRDELRAENRRLREERTRLRAALKPFADRADAWIADVPDDEPWTLCNDEGDCIAYELTPGDFRRARNVLTAE
jgi:hypothetical protein